MYVKRGTERNNKATTDRYMYVTASINVGSINYVYRQNGRNSLVTAVEFYSNMRCLKCVYKAKVAYVNCGAWFI